MATTFATAVRPPLNLSKCHATTSRRSMCDKSNDTRSYRYLAVVPPIHLIRNKIANRSAHALHLIRNYKSMEASVLLFHFILHLIVANLDLIIEEIYFSIA